MNVIMAPWSDGLTPGGAVAGSGGARGGSLPSAGGQGTAVASSAGSLPSPRTGPGAVESAAFRALIVDPDLVNGVALAKALRTHPTVTTDHVSDAAAAQTALAQRPGGDLLLVSLALGSGALATVAAAKRAGWHRVLAMAPSADIGPVVDAIGAGVHGVLIGQRANPAAASVPTSIHDLSAREVEVLQLVADGRSNKWIGERLQLSALTVKSHLARIGRKLGTGDRAHMVALALRAGVLS